MPRSPDADSVGPTFGNGRATEELRDRVPSGSKPDAIRWRCQPASPFPRSSRVALPQVVRRESADMLGLLVQIGAVPAPA
jgi:hypothetical protein